MSSISYPEFKIVVMGAEAVGKTALIKRWRTGEFEKRHLATVGADVSPINFNTTKGMIRFNVWDCAGKPELEGLGDGYLIAANAAIIMFDVTNAASFSMIDEIYKNIRCHHEQIPIVLCGNKVDCASRKIHNKHVAKWVLTHDVHYCDISARSNYNFEHPWLYLLRQLNKDQSLMFQPDEPETKIDEKYDDSNDEAPAQKEADLDELSVCEQIKSLVNTVGKLTNEINELKKLVEKCM